MLSRMSDRNIRSTLIPKTLRIFRNCLASLGLLWLIATLTPLDTWWATKLAGSWNDPGGDVLVVLGGSVLDDGTIGEDSYWRAVYAVRVWKEHNFKELVVCGGSGTSTAMRTFLVANGVPENIVIAEKESSSTRENAEFAKPILSAFPGTKVLLTSDYHMFRAERTFAKVGISVIPQPFPDIRKRAFHPLARWGAFLDLIQESAKIVFYKWKGWI